MRNLLFFDSMLTPKIITFVYWLLIFLCFVAGIGAMFRGYGGLTFGKFLMGVGIMAGGAVGTRIWCEMMIVMFKIHENLKKIADRGDE